MAVVPAPNPARSVATPTSVAPPTPIVRLVESTSDRRRQLAEVLETAGPGAVASHAAAAHLWGFTELLPWRAEVSSRRCDRYALRKVRAHRTLDLRPDDVTVVRGVPCTTLARTIVDLSGRCSEWELLEVFDRGVAAGLITAEELRARCERLRQAPGRRKSVVRAVLARSGIGGARRPALAERVVAVVTSLGLPALASNMPVAVGTQVLRLPLTYPAARVAIACETWGYAPTPIEQSLRHALHASGWRVVPVRWSMTEADIATAISRALSVRR